MRGERNVMSGPYNKVRCEMPYTHSRWHKSTTKPYGPPMAHDDKIYVASVLKKSKAQEQTTTTMTATRRIVIHTQHKIQS